MTGDLLQQLALRGALILGRRGYRGLPYVWRQLRNYVTVWEPTGDGEYWGELYRRLEIGKQPLDSGPYVLLPVGERIADLIDSMLAREARSGDTRRAGRGAKALLFR